MHIITKFQLGGGASHFLYNKFFTFHVFFSQVGTNLETAIRMDFSVREIDREGMEKVRSLFKNIPKKVRD